MVRAKSVLNMIMMSVGAMGVVGVLWVLFGYSIAFGDDKGGLIGDPTEFFGLKDCSGVTTSLTPRPHGRRDPAGRHHPGTGVRRLPGDVRDHHGRPDLGAVADRMKYGAWLLFAGLWATVVYFPVAHWVFSFDGVTAETGGWIANKLGAIDFAGGTAVHINAGVAGLVLALMLVSVAAGPRRPSVRTTCRS